MRGIAQHKAPAALFAGSLLFIFGGMLWAYFVLRGIPQPLIVHFTARTGITEVGTLSYLLINGVFYIVACVVNAAIAVPLLVRDRRLVLFLAGGTFAVSILIFIWYAAIIHVN